MRRRIAFVAGLLVIALAPLGGGRALAAAGAATLTPDGLSFLVSKDVGVERWVVSLNVSPSDGNAIANVTGNVFKSDGSPPSFVMCRTRDDSTGTLEDPASVFRFSCDGADACPTSARECGRTSWRRIGDDLALPSQFFLPDGGFAKAATIDRAAWARLLLSPWQKIGSWLTPAAEAQTNNRGATLSLDGLSFLVNKDLAQERWSVGLNYLPVRNDDGGVVNRLQAITGGVLRSDGTSTFVYCSIRDDSVGTLDDPSSTFRLSCFGTDGCATTAEECARSGWTLIADDVSIAASFFLPPGGLSAMPHSDPQIAVNERPSAAPAYETPDYTTPGGAAAGGTCAVGGVCLATRVGSCTQVRGQLVDGASGCLCRIDEIDPSCIACDGASASGQCGEECAFAVGGFTVRGVCLPEASSSSDCFCHGIGAGEPLAVARCSGPLDGSCTSGRCCTDDPTDGCAPDGSAACPGVCVAGSCDGSAESCGICFATGSTPTPEPTVEPTPNGKPTPRATPSPGPSVADTPRPTATAAPSPKPTASPRPSAAPTPSRTPSPTASPPSTPASTTTPLASPKPTASPAPTVRPTVTPSPSPSPEPMATPSPEPSCGDRHKDPGEQCEPTLNNCGGNLCSSVTCQCFSCTPQSLRGDNGIDSVETYDLGISVGIFGFKYDAFQSDADHFIVSYEGQVLLDSGCDTGGVPDFYKLELPGGTSTKIQVQVMGSCNGGRKGSWEYFVGCPE